MKPCLCLSKPGLQKPGLQKPGLQKPGLRVLALVFVALALMACGTPHPKTVAEKPENVRFAYLQNSSPHGVMVPESRPCEPDPNWRYADTPSGEEVLVIKPGAMVCAAFPERLVTANFVAMKLQRGAERPVALPVRIGRGVCAGQFDLRDVEATEPVVIEANCPTK